MGWRHWQARLRTPQRDAWVARCQETLQAEGAFFLVDAFEVERPAYFKTLVAAEESKEDRPIALVDPAQVKLYFEGGMEYLPNAFEART